MSSWIEPPPPRKGMGCFGKGCVILLCFFGLLVFAFIIGGVVASRSLDQYLSREPMPLEPAASDVEAGVTPEPAPPVEAYATPTPPSVEPMADVAGPESAATLYRGWEDFENAAKRGEPARIEMTGEELNALFDSYSNLRGKIRADIHGNRGILRASYPISDIPLLKSVLKDRYINVEGIVSSAPDRSPQGARFESLKVNDQSVSVGRVEQEVRRFGALLRGSEANRWSLDQWKLQFSQDHNLTVFDLADGKMILEANTPR